MANSSTHSLSAHGQRAAEFPLDESLRGRVAGLSLEERRRAAGCGVFLVDANFVDFSCWREVALEGKSSSLDGDSTAVVADRGVPIARAFRAPPRVVRDPGKSGRRSGTSRYERFGRSAYRELSIGDLAQIARCHPDWVRPRWPIGSTCGAQLIEEARRRRPENPDRLTLRCLEVSAGDLNWLSAYVEPSA